MPQALTAPPSHKRRMSQGAKRILLLARARPTIGDTARSRFHSGLSQWLLTLQGFGRLGKSDEIF